MNSDGSPDRASPVREFGGFVLDLRRRLLFAPGGAAVPLTPRVLDTLACMVQNPGVLLGRDRLMDSIWPDTAVEPNNLSQNVAKLRRLFGERPGQNRFIETVPGRGYRFIAAVRTASTARVDGESSVAAPQDAEARRLYRQALRLLQRPTAPNCAAAVEALEAALRLEPRFASARAWLADAHLLSVNAGHAGREGLAAAEQHARAALEVEPKGTVAHAVLATVFALGREWLAAESHFLTALSLDEGDPLTRSLHATFLLQQVGHGRRALAQLRSAYELLPDDPRMLMNLAMSSSIAGDDAEAMRCARLATAFGYPDGAYPLSLVFLRDDSRARRYDGAIARASALLSSERWQRETVPAVYAALGDRGAAAAAVAALRTVLESDFSHTLRTRGALLVAVQWLVELGATELAFDALDRALATAGPPPHWQTLWVPELEPLRAHARFARLAERLGFAAYWRVFGPPDSLRAAHPSALADA